MYNVTDYINLLMTASYCLFLCESQAIYERMFVYVVKKINENVEAHLTEDETSTVISVLDIYGFEVFGVNRLAASDT